VFNYIYHIYFLYFRFYLQLIICYELYLNKSYEESLLEIENVVKYLETCIFDESNEQYSDAYNHIARATNAYIAITLNQESDKVILIKYFI
jgi:exonuclease VII small subunit